MRTLLLSAALFLSVPTAFACPMRDAAEFAAAVEGVRQAEGTKVAFNVEGLTCNDCSTKVTKALKNIEGVNAAAVDYQTGRAEIAFDAGKTTPDALLEVIIKAGYKAEADNKA